MSDFSWGSALDEWDILLLSRDVEGVDQCQDMSGLFRKFLCVSSTSREYSALCVTSGWRGKSFEGCENPMGGCGVK